MTNTIFNQFLERQTPELTNRFGHYLAGIFPMLPREAVSAINADLVPFFLGRMLNTLDIDSPLAQRVIAGTLEAGVSQEHMRKNIGEFFSILNELCVSDPALNQTEQIHIQRILEQSHKFLLLNIFLVKPQNIKKD